MPQARYQPANEGHFGLASTAYCHFTSPIRRYADLLVHRALKASLGHAENPLPAGQKLWRITDQLNRRERAAMECEREMARRLGCLALQGHEGKIFDGVITAVTKFGFFVTLSSMPVEGLVHVRDLDRERHVFDALRHCLSGLVTGRQWQMGRRLDIRIAGVNPGRLELRFVPVDIPDAANAAGRRARAYKRGVRSRAERKH